LEEACANRRNKMTAYTPIYCTATDIYYRTGLSSTEVDLSVKTQIIEDAETELEMLTGRKFTSGTARVEYLNIKGEDVLGNKVTVFSVGNFPIQSIAEFKKLDVEGDAEETYDNLTSAQISAGTFETDDYWLDVSEDPVNNSISPMGTIRMKTDSFSEQGQKIKISYTYGYSSVPVPVRNLATCLAGIRMWITFMGGNYSAINSYGIPQQNVNKGDFYVRGKMMIDELQAEADRLLDRIGRKSRMLFFATGGVR
jgi:hypothetical protein